MDLKRLTLIFFLPIIAAIEVRRYSYDLNENDYCGLDPYFYSGKCKKLSKCRNLLVAKKRIEICSFGSVLTSKLGNALVCCSREDFYASRRLNGEGVLSFDKCKEKYKSIRPTESQLFEKYVVNGEEVDPLEFSHVAAIGWLSWFDFSVKWNCGGSLITEKFVLSAAHCMSFNGIKPNVVRLGDIDLNSPHDDQFVQQFGIKKVITHPEYDFNDNRNDIGLILLLGSVVPTQNVVPACINPFEYPEYLEGAGYGASGFGELSTYKLLKASLKLVDVPTCQESYHLKISEDSQMCAQSYRDDIEEQDLCYGDSGGALQYLHKDIQNGITYKIPTIVSITSFGIGCAFGVPAVYVNVSYYIDWIESIVSP